MKTMKTLSRPVGHRVNIRQDKQRFDALDQAFDELIAEIAEDMAAQYVYSHLPVLRYVAPVMDLIVDGNMILIVEESRILPVDKAGMNRTQITKALMAAVKGTI